MPGRSWHHRSTELLLSAFSNLQCTYHQSVVGMFSACHADQFSAAQDVTSREEVERERGCDRRVAVYGFLRGCAMKPGARVHLAGVGDFTVSFPHGFPLPPHTHTSSPMCQQALLKQSQELSQTRWLLFYLAMNMWLQTLTSENELTQKRSHKHKSFAPAIFINSCFVQAESTHVSLLHLPAYLNHRHETDEYCAVAGARNGWAAGPLPSAFVTEEEGIERQGAAAVCPHERCGGPAV